MVLNAQEKQNLAKRMRFPSIDILRITAIIMVVSWHTGWGWQNVRVSSFLLNHVPLLIALSFFLSNELIELTSFKNMVAFAAKRCVRIFRLYFFWLLLWTVCLGPTKDGSLLVLLLTGRGALYFLPLLAYLVICYAFIRLIAALVSPRRGIFYILALGAFTALIYAVLKGGLRQHLHSLHPEAQLFVSRLIILSPFALLGLMMRGYYDFIRKSFFWADFTRPLFASGSMRTVIPGAIRWIIVIGAVIAAFWLGFLNETVALGMLGAHGVDYMGLLRIASVFLLFYAGLALEDWFRSRERFCRVAAACARITPGVFCIHTIIWQWLNGAFGLPRDGSWLTVLTLVLSFGLAAVISRLGKVGEMAVT